GRNSQTRREPGSRARRSPAPGTTDDGGNTRGGCGPAEKTETIGRRETNKRRSGCRFKVSSSSEACREGAVAVARSAVALLPQCCHDRVAGRAGGCGADALRRDVDGKDAAIDGGVHRALDRRGLRLEAKAVAQQQRNTADRRV